MELNNPWLDVVLLQWRVNGSMVGDSVVMLKYASVIVMIVWVLSRVIE